MSIEASTTTRRTGSAWTGGARTTTMILDKVYSLAVQFWSVIAQLLGRDTQK